MNESKIGFAAIPWQEVAPGLRVKRREAGGKALRLLEFSYGYDGEAWCDVGHTGYVLEGGLTLAFDDAVITYGAGDGLRIGDGRQQRHRTIMGPGERALVFVCEDL
jgi:hypothetical protein